WVIILTQRGTASLGRIRAILDLPPAVADEEPLVDLGSGGIRGDVRFRDLIFSYAEASEPALRGIEAAAAQTVALVARPGAGKSTLLSLIPRLFNPLEPALLVDGIDVRRLRLAD